MKKIILASFLCMFTACITFKAPDNVKYDFTTLGPLTADIFQVIIINKSDEGLKTQSAQRESSYINAMNIIRQECVRQLFRYYYEQKKTDQAGIPAEKLTILNREFAGLAEDAVIEQEYYAQDNSVVLILRIYKRDIINKIINY